MTEQAKAPFCTACGNRLNENDNFCGKCGHKVAPEPAGKSEELLPDGYAVSRFVTVALIVALVGGPAILYFFGERLFAPDTRSAEAAVRGLLYDPSSAQFRDVERCPRNRDVLRGEFNGKNLMGGYEGFKPFYYDGVSAITLGDGRFSGFTQICYHGGDPKKVVDVDSITEAEKAVQDALNAADR